MTGKYRVCELVKFNYSDVFEYVDDEHTDRPLRNDELVKLLNKQDNLLEKYALSYEDLEYIIERLKKENEQLKQDNHGLAEKQIRLVEELTEKEQENRKIRKENEQFKQQIKDLWFYLVKPQFTE